VPAIAADSLSKEYRLGQIGHTTLREVAGSLAQRVRTLRRVGKPETIWALRDVDLEIDRGEIVGLIGRNGAGKTTLLKVLSRITDPTAGTVRIEGRVGSLLEVGTGFHPDLTGRENVFLNGAILGMRRAEVARKFDEIVAFAGIDRFVDTPVKRYSSGMSVRLAFSVAAHLEPEILLVDEVLAVGDADFQRKCLGRMQSIGESDRTVLFVSHDLNAIGRLCSRVLLFDGGRLLGDGPPESVIPEFLHEAWELATGRTWGDADAPGTDDVKLRAVRVVDGAGRPTRVVDVRERAGIELTFEVLGWVEPFAPWIRLRNDRGEHVFSSMDVSPRWRSTPERGVYRATMWIPPQLLNEGSHLVSLSLETALPRGQALHHAQADEAIAFQVIDPGDGTTARGLYAGPWPGPVRPLLEWNVEHRSSG
jgi:lipopolysaccharide transport system ATP-binding protein